MAGVKIRYEDYVDDLYNDEEEASYSRTKERRDLRDLDKEFDRKKVKKIRNSEFV